MLSKHINGETKGTRLGEFIEQRQEERRIDRAVAESDAADKAAAAAKSSDSTSGGHTPSVISLGQVWVDIMMDVDELPEPGGFAVSNAARPVVGGSYRVLDAVSSMGVPAEHAGIIGNGVWAAMIREAYEHDGITHVGPCRLDADSGFRLVFHDDDGRKTFVARYGVEAQGDARTFDAVEPEAGDVVHVSGNTLLDHTAAGIDEFMHRAGDDPKSRPYRLVINPTNTLKLVNDHLLEDLVLARPTWSCNRQEANTLAERLGVDLGEAGALTVGGGFDQAMNALCDALGNTLRAPLVVRAGSRGAWVREPGGEVQHVEGYPTKGVHTRSAGSCHTGAMCAMLAKGWSLADAVNIANAAASLAIQRHRAGVPVCPSYKEAVTLAGVAAR
ncbi:PfkB family carbohydrate kinase [Bifidobacterium stellenboschense]|uniref:Carbohydrate kinase, PfkB family n=1 Tax=Bifidobacterium stellenboschense TaxID=762211 RepID=A0A087DJQ4_9BIFI|nr:PfkB family carbohydrate kinase [Bifidobacterium stellenboschense]KFI95754.1 carbohydrate kinase, PfkB family [Bifidobacterium stellenboschense]